ncbi:hypothetical protein HY572_06825 [Candidatus Micrarchaeota archaeon]|nr:hypothetical protein [Candidatus Micrarchaeota archaeon]
MAQLNKPNSEVLSISLPAGQLTALSAMQKKLGFSNRSKLLRAGLEALLNEYKLVDELDGFHKVVFVVSHDKHHEHDVDHVLHDFEDEVSTSVHQQSQNACIQVLMAEGNASRLKALYHEVKKAKGVKQVHAFIL